MTQLRTQNAKYVSYDYGIEKLLAGFTTMSSVMPCPKVELSKLWKFPGKSWLVNDTMNTIKSTQYTRQCSGDLGFSDAMH